MTLSNNNDPIVGAPLALTDVVHLLGHTQLTGIMHKPLGGDIGNYFIEPRMVPAVVSGLVDGDIWYGINEVRENPGRYPNGKARRATTATVSRWCAIWADLDVKPGGFHNLETIQAVITALSDAYGTRPTWITASGNGLQPVWLIAADDPEAQLDGDDGTRRAQAVALMRRHGRLVQAIAAEHGGDADPVFDLARVLRAPGTHNHKSVPPKETAAWRDEGTPLTITHLRACLDHEGITEMPNDTETIHAPVVSAPRTWRPRTTDAEGCGYAQRMTDGWASDHPDARHPWLVAQATRVACARRYGCLTAADEAAVRRELENRFHQLCGSGAQARRVSPAEVRGALDWGEQLVATFTDARVAEELGGHEHRGGGSNDNIADLDDSHLNALAARPARDEPGSPRAAGRGEVGSPRPSAGSAPGGRTPDATPDAPSAPPGITDDGQLILGDHRHDTELEAIEGDFWTRRPELAQVFRVALLSYTAPWAVLGQMIARTLAAIPPEVQLAPVGSYAAASRTGGSLNLHIAILGRSGQGKGESSKVAAALSRTTGYEVRGIGSGEGLAAMYCEPDPGNKQKNIMVRHNILLNVPEIDAFSRLTERNSSTLDVVLREAYSGERLGREYRNTNKMPVDDHTYRLTSTIGVQYARAGVLLNTASGDGGTAQRFLWVDTFDPRAGGVKAAKAAVAGRQLPAIRLPRDIPAREWPKAYQHEFVRMPDAARAAIEDQRIANMCASPEADANLDSHALFTRCKVAVALAALAGRTAVDDEDWELSGTVMAASRLARDRAAAALRHSDLKAASERGEMRGVEWEQAKATEKTQRDEKVREVGLWIMDRVIDAGEEGSTLRELRLSITKAHRPYVSDALQALVAASRVEAIETGRTTRYVAPLAE